MDPSYRIEPDVRSGLLAVTLLGFFTIEDVAGMRTALRSAIANLNRRPGDHVSLYDICECKIQSQDVVRAMRAMSDAKGIVARRLAVVTGASLMRMQLPRILVDRNARYFEEVKPAREWLLEASRPTAQYLQPRDLGASPAQR